MFTVILCFDRLVKNVRDSNSYTTQRLKSIGNHHNYDEFTSYCIQFRSLIVEGEIKSDLNFVHVTRPDPAVSDPVTQWPGRTWPQNVLKNQILFQEFQATFNISRLNSTRVMSHSHWCTGRAYTDIALNDWISGLFYLCNGWRWRLQV